jgi:hypothetical protein
MSTATGYYSIIQYCPDPSRLEAANVGVVLFCPELNYLGARTARGNDRIRRFFRPLGLDRDQLNTIKMSIQRRLEIDRDQFKELADLERFAATRANAMRLTPPRVVAVDADVPPERLLEQLFERLVGGRAPKTTAQVRGALEEAFRAESVSPLVQRNVVVTLPVFNQQITVPYGFQNGRFNLIQPAMFRGLAPPAILERAGKYALAGDLLFNAPDNTLGDLKMVVVGQFAPNQTEVARTVGELLAKNNTTLYRTDEINKLVEEIRTTGRRPSISKH